MRRAFLSFTILQTKTRCVLFDLQLKSNDTEFSDTPTEFHTCMVELKQKEISDDIIGQSNFSQFKMVSECQIRLKAVLWRFVPHCSEIGKWV